MILFNSFDFTDVTVAWMHHLCKRDTNECVVASFASVVAVATATRLQMLRKPNCLQDFAQLCPDATIYKSKAKGGRFCSLQTRTLAAIRPDVIKTILLLTLPCFSQRSHRFTRGHSLLLVPEIQLQSHVMKWKLEHAHQRPRSTTCAPLPTSVKMSVCEGGRASRQRSLSLSKNWAKAKVHLYFMFSVNQRCCCLMWVFRELS